MERRIITAWAETCRGPGWANRIVWMLIQEEDGTLTRKAVQPGEQTADMLTLFTLSEAANDAMTAACRREVK